MQSYTHFTLTERENLRVKVQEGKTMRAIARELGRSASSISRELRRNHNKKTGQYNAWGATSLYLKRRKRCRRHMRYEVDEALRSYTQERLKRFWPPEAIAAVWKREHPGETLSHTTIYAALTRGLLPGCSAKAHLRRRGKQKHARGATATLKPERFIKDRCKEANNRSRLGDFEGDTVLGGIGKGCLLTCVDRKSRFLLAAVSPDKSVGSIQDRFIEVFAGNEPGDGTTFVCCLILADARTLSLCEQRFMGLRLI